MRMISASSSVIIAIGHDPITLNMKIRFKGSNKLYDYCNVPEEVFNHFLRDTYIKDKYNCY